MAAPMAIFQVPFQDWWTGECVPQNDNPTQIICAIPLEHTGTIDAIIVQAKHANQDIIYVGNSANQFFELAPGETVTLPVNNINNVYIRRTAGSDGDGVNYIAGVF